MLDKRKFYIDGEWVSPIAALDLEVLNPGTEKPIAVISMGSEKDIAKAVEAAKNAFASYSRTTLEERLRLLERFLAIYKRRYDEMAETITLEAGMRDGFDDSIVSSKFPGRVSASKSTTGTSSSGESSRVS